MSEKSETRRRYTGFIAAFGILGASIVAIADLLSDAPYWKTKAYLISIVCLVNYGIIRDWWDGRALKK